MTTHLNPEPVNPVRVVVLGASGFIGSYLLRQLRTLGIASHGVSSKDVDLAAPAAVEQLKGMLHKEDAVVFASCLTPDKGKDIRTAMRNLAMGEHTCAALQAVGCAHVVYLSSDAVYADSESLVREDSRCEPSSLYGLAHFTRERMVRGTAEAMKTPWLIVRPTLVYGEGDTHNSYGVNRFVRQLRDTGVIKLFGKGEEQRDHVHVTDVARFLALCLRHRTTGILNLATGTSTSFREIAETCLRSSPKPGVIECLPRSGAITHRHFDVSAALRAFPQLRFTSLPEGVAVYCGQRVAA